MVSHDHLFCFRYPTHPILTKGMASCVGFLPPAIEKSAGGRMDRVVAFPVVSVIERFLIINVTLTLTHLRVIGLLSLCCNGVSD